jgi:uncharacterized membrane protein
MIMAPVFALLGFDLILLLLAISLSEKSAARRDTILLSARYIYTDDNMGAEWRSWDVQILWH